MTTLTIDSNDYYNIHSIANQHCGREIKFAPGCKYAVVLASYYGGKGYTTHKTEISALKMSRKLKDKDFSHKIIDINGTEMIESPHNHCDLVYNEY